MSDTSKLLIIFCFAAYLVGQAVGWEWGKMGADRWYADHRWLEYRIVSVPYVPVVREGDTNGLTIGKGWSASCLLFDGNTQQITPNYDYDSCWKPVQQQMEQP